MGKFLVTVSNPINIFLPPDTRVCQVDLPPSYLAKGTGCSESRFNEPVCSFCLLSLSLSSLLFSPLLSARPTLENCSLSRLTVTWKVTSFAKS